ncbi:MAG: DNA-binding HxlR family transcriptional regulator, partial [Oleiphilaceae bacterium]
METFGDKWTLLVIRDLMFKGKQYYSDFLASDERVSTNILADRLQKLEVKGV